MIVYSNGPRAYVASVIYCVSLVGMYGISALYHIPVWSRKNYLILRRIDHATIFILIAGSATPICLLSLNAEPGLRLLAIFWLVAITGMFIATIWTHAPKWIRSFLYVAMGWIGILYFPEIKSSLDTTNLWLLVTGGIIYTLGALVYAFKWPDPIPSVFGYHEVFHVFVVIASACHFCLNYNLVT